MKIDTVRTTDEGSPQSASAQWTVTSPVGELPRRFFRRELLLRFSNPAGGDRMVIDPSATKLKVKFLDFDYDALNPEAGLPAGGIRYVDGSRAAIVELDAPREFLSVKFAAPGFLGGRSLQVYRVDGEAIADKPALTQTATLLFPEAETVMFSAQAAPFGGAAPAAARLQRAEPFVDARFAFRLSTNEVLSASNVQRVNVRGRAAAPRIGIVSPGSQTGVVHFARPDPGVFFPAGELLAAELNRILARLEALPPDLLISVVFDSDEPCRVEISQFEIVYRLCRQSFPGGDEKQILRFDRGALASREVIITVPGNGSIHSAVIEVQESFGPDRPVGTGAVALESSVGIALFTGRCAAQDFTPDRAMTINGIALAAAGLEPAAELLVSLREDWQSGPGGSTLGEGKLILAEAGLPQWLTVTFREPVILSSRPYWILVKVARGAAVWLASEGSKPAHVLAVDGAGFSEISVLDGIQGLFYFLSSQADPALPFPVRVTVGNQPVEAAPVQPGSRRTLDLSVALRSLVPAPGAAADISIPVVFSSGIPGSITVYPPRVEYEIE